MSTRDPDAAVVALFRNHTIPNIARTAELKRPQFDDMEVVEIRFAGSRSVSVFPATERSHWIEDPVTREPIPVTYAERFARQYQQFKAQVAQTKAGTPLDYCPFLTEARRAELRAQNIYTAEALAAVEGQELKNLGPGGRDLKNKAMDFIAQETPGASNLKVQEELDILKAKYAVLEEDNKRLQVRGADKQPGTPDPDNQFDGMTLDQLREYITATTGMAPHGSIGRKTLVRMATDAHANEKQVA